MEDTIIFIGKYDEGMRLLQENVINKLNELFNHQKNTNSIKLESQSPPNVVKCPIENKNYNVWTFLGNVKPTFLLKNLISKTKIILFVFNVDNIETLKFLRKGWEPIIGNTNTQMQIRYLIGIQINKEKKLEKLYFDQIKDHNLKDFFKKIKKEFVEKCYLKNRESTSSKSSTIEEDISMLIDKLKNEIESDNKEEEIDKESEMKKAKKSDSEQENEMKDDIDNHNNDEKEEEKRNSNNDHNVDDEDEDNRNADDDDVIDDFEEFDDKEEGIVIKEPNYIVYKLFRKTMTAHVTESPEVKGDVFIPRCATHKYEEYKITRIESKSFCGTSIESLSFASSSCVRSIGSYAFYKSTVRHLSIPRSVRKLDDFFAYGANNLSEIEISESNRYFSYKEGNLVFHNQTEQSNENEKERHDEMILALNDFTDKTNENYTIQFTKSENFLSIRSNKQSLKFFNFEYYSKCQNIHHIEITSQSQVDLSPSCFCETKFLTTLYINSENVLIGDSCFKNCSNLDLVLMKKLRQLKIGCEAFRGCESLKSLEISSRLRLELCDRCFCSLANLQSLTLSSDELIIGDNCFMNCKSLSYISFKDVYSLKTGRNSFSQCESLKELKIGVYSNLELGEYCFSGSTSLQSVEISGVTDLKIRDGSFENCTSLNSINFPDSHSVTFGSHSFAGCNKLQNVLIPKAASVYFFKNSFQGTKSLRSLYLNCSELGICENSFDKYVPITSFTFSKLKKIFLQVNNFSYFSRILPQCKYLEEIAIEINPNEIMKLNSLEQYLYLKVIKIISKSSIKLEKNTISKLYYIESFEFTCSSLTICSDCFNYKRNLKKLKFTVNELIIGDSCFKNCMKLESISFEKLNKAKIGSQAFYGCKSLQIFNITSESYIEICDECFYFASNLRSFSISSPELIIGNKCFGNNISFNKESLEKVKTLSVNVDETNIYAYIISQCINLESITIKSNEFDKINWQIIEQCSLIKTLNLIINSLVKLKGELFTNLEKLETISISSYSLTIASDCFNGHQNLYNFKFDGYELNIGDSSFKNCINLKSFSLKNIVYVTIGFYPFECCENLDTFSIIPSYKYNIKKYIERSREGFLWHKFSSIVKEIKTGIKYCADSSQSEIKDTLDYVTFFEEIISFSSLLNSVILRFHGFSLLDFDMKYHPIVFTEYVYGCFLEEKIGNTKLFTSTQRYIILVGIVNGMKYLHSKNIIHKNLTPSSIVLDEHMYPHIKYFPMQIADTNEYTAPETINRKEFSFKSDVYSFSMIAYELLTSTHPFDKYKTSDLIQKVCHKGERPEMKYIGNETIRSLLQRCWSSDATERPSFDIIFQEITKYQIMQSFKANKEEFEKYLRLFKHEEKVRNPTNPEKNGIKNQSFDSSVNYKFESSDSNSRSDSIDNFESDTIIIMRYLRSVLFNKESSLKKIRIENKSEITGSLADLKSKILTSLNLNVLCYSVEYDSEYSVEYYGDQTPIQELPPYLNMQIKPAKGHDYRICVLCDISKLQKQADINDDFFSIAIDFVNYNNIDEFKQKIIDYIRLQSAQSIQLPDIYIFKNQTFERIIQISEIEDNKTPFFVSWNPEQFDQIEEHIATHVSIQEGLNQNIDTGMKDPSSSLSQHDNRNSGNQKTMKNDNDFESMQTTNIRNSIQPLKDKHNTPSNTSSQKGSNPNPKSYFPLSKESDSYIQSSPIEKSKDEQNEMKETSSSLDQLDNQDHEIMKPTESYSNNIESKPNTNDIKVILPSTDSHAENDLCSTDSNSWNESNEEYEEDILTVTHYLRSKLFEDKQQVTKYIIENKTKSRMRLADLKTKIYPYSQRNVLFYSVKFDSKYLVEYYDDQTLIQELPPYLNIQIRPYNKLDYRICILCDISQILSQSYINNDFIYIAICINQKQTIVNFRRNINDYFRSKSAPNIQLPEIYIFTNKGFTPITKITELGDDKTPVFAAWNSEQFNQFQKYIFDHTTSTKWQNQNSRTDMATHVSTQKGPNQNSNIRNCIQPLKDKHNTSSSTSSQKGSNQNSKSYFPLPKESESYIQSGPIEKSKDEQNEMKETNSPLDQLDNQGHVNTKPTESCSNIESKPNTNDIKAILPSTDSHAENDSYSTDSNSRSESNEEYEEDTLIIMHYSQIRLFDDKEQVTKLIIKNKTKIFKVLGDLKSKILLISDPNVLCYSIKYDSKYFVEYYDDQTPIQDLPPFINIQNKPSKFYDYRVCVLCDKSQIESKSRISNDCICIALHFNPSYGLLPYKQRIIHYLYQNTVKSIQSPDIYIFKENQFSLIPKNEIIQYVEDNKTPLFFSWNSEEFDQIKRHIAEHTTIQEEPYSKTASSMKKIVSIETNGNAKTIENGNDFEYVSSENINRIDSTGKFTNDIIIITRYIQAKFYGEKTKVTKFTINIKPQTDRLLGDLASKILPKPDSKVLCYSFTSSNSRFSVKYYDYQTPIHELPPHLNIQVGPRDSDDYRVCVLCDIAKILNQTAVNDEFFPIAIDAFNCVNIFQLKIRILYSISQNNSMKFDRPNIYEFKGKNFKEITDINLIPDKSKPLFVSWSSSFGRIREYIVSQMATQNVI